MEISKMITISTAHIRPETAILLTQICNGVIDSELIVYKKKDNNDYYGWFIYCNVIKQGLNIPDDLMKLMCFTSDSNIDWLCLDRDGNVLDNKYLNTYEW